MHDTIPAPLFYVLDGGRPPVKKAKKLGDYQQSAPNMVKNVYF
jgi:hypothetical protein